MTTATLSALINKTPGVCGGRACIRSTRITVWGLEELRRLGFSEQRILNDYPDVLTADDLRAAWKYVAEHRAEIDKDIRQNTEEA